MKYLVGAACIAVIAASVFIIGKPWYDGRVAQVQSEKMHREANVALSEYAKLMPAGYNTVPTLCHLAGTSPDIFKDGKGETVANTCRFVGISTN